MFGRSSNLGITRVSRFVSCFQLQANVLYSNCRDFFCNIWNRVFCSRKESLPSSSNSGPGCSCLHPVAQELLGVQKFKILGLHGSPQSPQSILARFKGQPTILRPKPLPTLRSNLVSVPKILQLSTRLLSGQCQPTKKEFHSADLSHRRTLPMPRSYGSEALSSANRRG